jgi:hypothetical protein
VNAKKQKEEKTKWQAFPWADLLPVPTEPLNDRKV